MALKDMSNYTFQICSRIKHYITARYTLGYNIHSPLLYDFTRNVIYEENPYYIFNQIERQRQQLLINNKTINVTDYGTGASGNRTIAHIAKTSLATPDEAQLLFRIANYLHARNILELGTSLGITTSYLAAHDSHCRVTTMEGSDAIADIAHQTWEKLNINQQITCIRGNITQQLPLYLKEATHFDIIYFDANHTYEATTEYFLQCLPYHHDNSIFIFDDIYHSPQMNRAWKQITQHPQVTATIDLYHLGLVFFNRFLIKNTYKMRF